MAGLGVVLPPPWPRGWSSHPQKPKKKKKGFGLLPPPKAWGWLRPPPVAVLEVVEPPPWPRGWSGNPKKKKEEKKNGFWAFGGGQTTPKGLRVDSILGVVRAPPGP
jgi:hypothetical protein